MANFVKNPTIGITFFDNLASFANQQGANVTEQQLKNNQNLKFEANLSMIHPFTMLFETSFLFNELSFANWITDESNMGHDVTIEELITYIEANYELG